MGWASGSELAEEIWVIVSKHIPKQNQKRVAQKIITAFEERDCDTIYECYDLVEAAGIKFNEDGEVI